LWRSCREARLIDGPLAVSCLFAPLPAVTAGGESKEGGIGVAGSGISGDSCPPPGPLYKQTRDAEDDSEPTEELRLSEESRPPGLKSSSSVVLKAELGSAASLSL
jgi:hypothetical protein